MIKSEIGKVSIVGTTNMITMDLAMAIKAVRNSVARKQEAAVANVVVDSAIVLSALDGEKLEGAIKQLIGDPELEVIAVKDNKQPVDNNNGVDMVAEKLWDNMMDEVKKILEGR